MIESALFTDFYELTMAQGYRLRNKDRPAVFDMFFRSSPFGGGFTVFAGLDSLLRVLESLRFTTEDLDYLGSLGVFQPEFLAFLGTFRFTGDIYTAAEGTFVFPNEPIIRVHADLVQAQLIESLLLNLINYQSLVATKSARVFLAADRGMVLEFGLRRAQGPDGAMSAARAAFIGGAAATSNTAAAKQLGIPAKGTMAHSWVMSFSSELEAFRAYAGLYPGDSVFLIDTYDTLNSGLENAIIVGKELADRGRSFGVRLDSGDLADLSVRVRNRLDQAGFGEAKIVLSNDLDEYEIERLMKKRAPVDVWGVGTRLVTGGDDPALTGVYKLSAVGKADGQGYQPVMKRSESAEKATNPGIKQAYRLTGADGRPREDRIALADEPPPPQSEPLLTKKMSAGEICVDLPPLAEIRGRTLEQLDRFGPGILALRPAEEYPVAISPKLMALKQRLSGSGATFR